MDFPRIVKVTAAYAAQWGELVLVDATAGPVVVRLPDPSFGLRAIGVKKTDASTNKVTVTCSGTSLIEGVASTILEVRYAMVELAGDGANWIVSGSPPPVFPAAPTIGTATQGDTTAFVRHTLNASGGALITATRVTPYIGTTAQPVQEFRDALLTHTVTGLTNGTAYTFTVQAVNSAGASLPSAASNAVTPAAFTPANIAGLAGWYKADALALADGAAVSSWTDSSAAVTPATQATAAKQPVYKTAILNGKPVVRFNGTTTALATTGYAFNQPATVFVVATSTVDSGYYVDGVATNTRVLARSAASTLELYGGAALFAPGSPALSAFSVLTGVFNGASSVGGYDGVETAGNAGTAAASGVTIGSAGDQGQTFLNGDVAEVIVYAAALTLDQRRQVQGYLGSKYAVFVA